MYIDRRAVALLTRSKRFPTVVHWKFYHAGRFVFQTIFQGLSTCRAWRTPLEAVLSCALVSPPRQRWPQLKKLVLIFVYSSNSDAIRADTWIRAALVGGTLPMRMALLCFGPRFGQYGPLGQASSHMGRFQRATLHVLRLGD